MMLIGMLPVTDHNERPIDGVNELFSNVISFTLDTYDERFNVPADIVGRAGYLVSRVTILKDYVGPREYVSPEYSGKTRAGVSLDIGRGIGELGVDSKDVDVLAWKSVFKKGEIYDTSFNFGPDEAGNSFKSIPSFFRYFEFEEPDPDLDSTLECRVELKLYYN